MVCLSSHPVDEHRGACLPPKGCTWAVGPVCWSSRARVLTAEEGGVLTSEWMCLWIGPCIPDALEELRSLLIVQCVYLCQVATQQDVALTLP